MHPPIFLHSVAPAGCGCRRPSSFLPRPGTTHLRNQTLAAFDPKQMFPYAGSNVRNDLRSCSLLSYRRPTLGFGG